MSIKDYYFGVTPIQPFNGEKYTFATGFFYENEEHIYLITNRHVVIDEKKDHYPKAVKIIIHSSPTRPRVVREVHIPLYDDDMNPMWLEYAHIESTFIDIIGLKISRTFFRKPTYYIVGLIMIWQVEVKYIHMILREFLVILWDFMIQFTISQLPDTLQ